MTTPRKVAVIIGSLRKDSFSRKLARAVITMAPASLKCEVVEIGQLPLFNQDHEADPPPIVRDFKARLESMSSVLFVTPEYNRSVPGVLKNALDIGSRPYGKNSWNAKPAAIISLSPGAIGAFGANHHLRQSLVALDMPTMAQPEAYIGNAAALFDEKGSLVNDTTRGFLQKFVDAFALWTERNAAR
jgi:chromate reductase